MVITKLKKPPLVVTCILLIIVIVAISNQLALTNYGIELDRLGVVNVEPVLGISRHITGSEIERLMIVPYFQIAVNNDFQRYNETSPFREDLRGLFSLPLHDWGLVFKPNFWLFGITNPAIAFSFHHVFTLLVFLLGYYFVFRKLKASPAVCVGLSVIFLYSAFLQFWWPYFGPIFAYFSLVLLAATANVRNWITVLLTYYFGTCWLISNLYPPLIITLAISGVAIVAVILGKRMFFSRVPYLLGGMVLAAATAYIYLGDAIDVIRNTSYPGAREISGGEGVSFIIWLGQFIPTLYLDRLQSIVGNDAAEIAGAGSFAILSVIVFLNYGQLRSKEHAVTRVQMFVLSIPLIAMWCWMFIPLPSWVGKPLLFHMVQGRRMFMACGLLLYAITALVLGKLNLKVSLLRVIIFGIIVFGLWFFQKVYISNLNMKPEYIFIDLGIVLLVYLVYLKTKYWKDAHNGAILVTAAAAVNVLAFGRMYPLQSADTIFNRPNTSITDTFDRIAKTHPDNLLVIPGEVFSGAILNGWGYRSASHAFYLPKPDYYRKYFHKMSETDFNFIFNRQSIIRLFYINEPEAPGIGIDLPVYAFGSLAKIRELRFDRPFGVLERDGGDFNISIQGTIVQISGWGRWSGWQELQRLHVLTPLAIVASRLGFQARGTTSEFVLSGFVLELELKEFWSGSKSTFPICLVASDPKYGVRILNDSNLNNCK